MGYTPVNIPFSDILELEYMYRPSQQQSRPHRYCRPCECGPSAPPSTPPRPAREPPLESPPPAPREPKEMEVLESPPPAPREPKEMEEKQK
uniref:Uncharacterized protein n=1 Tax=Panagrolaimus superbus TaxID=310955 RepID=A0A914Z6Q7_9BILA